MPIRDLVEVRILRNRQPLPEYPVPPSETAPSHQNVRYIEATAGERFEVRVCFLAGYRVENAINLVFKLSLDGEDFSPVVKDCVKLPVSNGALLSPIEICLGHICTNISETRANHFYYTFGVVELSMLPPLCTVAYET